MRVRPRVAQARVSVWALRDGLTATMLTRLDRAEALGEIGLES